MKNFFVLAAMRVVASCFAVETNDVGLECPILVSDEKLLHDVRMTPLEDGAGVLGEWRIFKEQSGFVVGASCVGGEVALRLVFFLWRSGLLAENGAPVCGHVYILSTDRMQETFLAALVFGGSRGDAEARRGRGSRLLALMIGLVAFARPTKEVGHLGSGLLVAIQQRG
jgi:hypothetical protein